MTIDNAYVLLSPLVDAPEAMGYRGLQRPEPAASVFASLQSPPPAQGVWTAHVDASINDDRWCSFLPTLELGRAFQERYKKAGFAFDLLRVQECVSEEIGRTEQTAPRFIGFDVVTSEPLSQIREWILVDQVPVPQKLEPIWRVAHGFFCPRLNESRLLHNYADAALLRCLMLAVVELAPDVFEPEDRALTIFSLSDVDEMTGSLR